MLASSANRFCFHGLKDKSLLVIREFPKAIKQSCFLRAQPSVLIRGRFFYVCIAENVVDGCIKYL